MPTNLAMMMLRRSIRLRVVSPTLESRQCLEAELAGATLELEPMFWPPYLNLSLKGNLKEFFGSAARPEVGNQLLQLRRCSNTRPLAQL